MSSELHYTCDVCGVKAAASEAHGWRRFKPIVRAIDTELSGRFSETDVCSPECAAKEAKRLMQVDLVAPRET